MPELLRYIIAFVAFGVTLIGLSHLPEQHGQLRGFRARIARRMSQDEQLAIAILIGLAVFVLSQLI